MLKKKLLAMALILISVIALNTSVANAEWKKDDIGWWYSDGKYAYAKNCWRQIDGNWYYFKSDGYMAYNTTIDGYYIDKNGVWNKSIDEVIKKIAQEDSKFIEKNNGKLKYFKEENTRDVFGDAWNIPTEPCYSIGLCDSNDDEAYIHEEFCTYVYGKETGNIYILPHQGNYTAYVVKDNKIVNRFKWLKEGTSTEWR